eukprot:1158699-Pelagomonas_calceolata.AAC.12
MIKCQGRQAGDSACSLPGGGEQEGECSAGSKRCSKLLCNTNPAEAAMFWEMAVSGWCWQMLAQLLANAHGS